MLEKVDLSEKLARLEACKNTRYKPWEADRRGPAQPGKGGSVRREKETVMEIEAKFTVPDRVTFDRLCGLETLGRYRLVSAGVKRVHDRYLDTAERAILRAGYACRVRRKGEARVATLKGLGGAEAGSGVHRRAEHEVPVEADDPASWPESPARELALELSGGQPLQELFALRQERHLRWVQAREDRVAELSLDFVTPLPGADGVQAPYYELEIELLARGRESDLRTLAREIKASWGLRPESRSKFERALARVA